MKGFDKKIIIVNSFVNYGGTIALAELCRSLRKLGCDARLLMVPYFPNNIVDKSGYKRFIIKYQLISLYNYLLYKLTGKERIHPFGDRYFFSLVNGCKLQFHPFFNKKRHVVIYPEVVFGNPLDANHVVRWLLYTTKYKNVPDAYSDTDLFIAYREIFSDTDLNPHHYIIHQASFNLDIYKQYNYGVRKGNCYIIRKGRNRPDLPECFDGPIVDILPEKEKVKIFNECNYCYCYDTQTAYTSIAAICGCIPIVVLEQGMTRKDYRKGQDKPGYGIAYGDSKEELEWAISTRGKLRESLDYSESNLQNAERLVALLKERFDL